MFHKPIPKYPREMKTFAKIFLILCFSVFFYSSVTDIQSEYIIPKYATSVVAADIDLDGNNDIIVGNLTEWGETNPTITIMKNNNYGTFEIADTSKVFCSTSDNFFAVDVNNDGYPDIVTFHHDFSNGTDVQYLRVYYNSNGTFPNNNYSDFPLNSNTTIYNSAFGDINGDGFTDIVVASNVGETWGVLYNDGTGHFSAPVYYPLNFPPGSIACGDLNNDGRDDVVISGQFTEVYLSYPSGFQLVVVDDVNLGGVVSIADMDSDGYKDIIKMYSYFGVTQITIYKNNGNNTFTNISNIQFPGDFFNFIISDFNNDNLPDVLLPNADYSNLLLYYNLGNCQLGNSQTIIITNGPGIQGVAGCYSADMDNNGFKDIIALTDPDPTSSSIVNILFNDGQGHFWPDPIVGLNNQNEVLSSMKNWPNPFQDQTTFEFTLHESSSKVELSILDFSGKFIICLNNQIMKGGTHSIKWHGLDQDGQSCKPGAYIVYLKVNGKVCNTIKVIKT